MIALIIYIGISNLLFYLIASGIGFGKVSKRTIFFTSFFGFILLPFAILASLYILLKRALKNGF